MSLARFGALSFKTEKRVLPGFGLSMGISVLFISLVLLLPMTGLFGQLAGLSLAEYWAIISEGRVVASYMVTIGAAAVAALVNAVFRDTKARLGEHLLNGIKPDNDPRSLFVTLWDRLVDFARQEPRAFRFLEMQDHARYLDDASRGTERELLGPLNQMVIAGQHAGVFNPGLRADVAIALFWGGVVGLFKAARDGYLELDDADLYAAREACWQALAAPGTGAIS